MQVNYFEYNHHVVRFIIALFFSLSHLFCFRVHLFPMFLDNYNFYASIFSPLWHGCGGLLCPVSACSVHLSCLTALGGLLYLLLHRVRPYTKFPSQSTPPGLCITSYLLFDTWSCLAGCKSTLDSLLSPTSRCHLCSTRIHPCYTWACIVY